MVTTLNDTTEKGGAEQGMAERHQVAKCALVIRTRSEVNQGFPRGLSQALGQSWDMISVGDLPAAMRAMRLPGITAVVLDVGQGWTRHVTKLLCRIRGDAARVPIVVVVGEAQETLGADAVGLGAAAYVSDGAASPGRVAQAVRHAVGETQEGVAPRDDRAPRTSDSGASAGWWLDESVPIHPSLRQRLAAAYDVQRREALAAAGKSGDRRPPRTGSAQVTKTAVWQQGAMARAVAAA